MQVATAQLPEINDSDDRIFVDNHAVVVLDGASAFVPGPVPASTYADRLGRHIIDSLHTKPDADLTVILADAISTTATKLDLTPGKSPSSTVSIFRQNGDQVDLLVLGDSMIVLPDSQITDKRIDAFQLVPRSIYQGRLAAGY